MRWGLASSRAAALGKSAWISECPRWPQKDSPGGSPAPGQGLTFQVAAGGRGEPLLGFAAHQLQADLQHGPTAATKALFVAPPPRAPSPARPRSPGSQPCLLPGPRPASRLGR